MSGTPAPADDEPKVTVTCGNCYQEKEVRVFSIGKDIKQFYDEHRTRIGRTYCSIQAIYICYDITKADRAQAVRAALEPVKHVVCISTLNRRKSCDCGADRINAILAERRAYHVS